MMIEYAQYAHPWHPRVGLFRRPRSWRAIASVPRHHGGDDTGGCLLSPPLTPIERGWEAINAALGAVLAALAPDQLSRRFARYKGHAPRVGDQDAWHWQMYRHYYEEMKSDRQRGLTRMFWEIFRQVYDREMRSKALAGLGEER